MRFTLEAVYAHHGDALILHYGPKHDPHCIVIDGGPEGAYVDFLRPRLEQIRQSWNLGAKSLPLDMVLVSHPTDHHFGGILELLDEQVAAHERRAPLPYDIGCLWHNTLDDLIGHQGVDLVDRLAEELAREEARAGGAIGPASSEVVAAAPMSRRLRELATKLGTATNSPFDDLVSAPTEHSVELPHGLRLTVLGPSREGVDAFRRAWREQLERPRANDGNDALASVFADEAPFHLGSLVVALELDGKRMLLTGDARGDDILRGLESAGLKQPGQPVHFDVIKLPHHGSHEYVTQDFFEQVTADVYVISGNGLGGRPDPTVLKMLAKARAGAPYQLRLTFTRNSSRELASPEQAKAMRRIERWIKKRRPSNCSIKHRHRRNRAQSTHVDVGDVPLDY